MGVEDIWFLEDGPGNLSWAKGRGYEGEGEAAAVVTRGHRETTWSFLERSKTVCSQWRPWREGLMPSVWKLESNLKTE